MSAAKLYYNNTNRQNVKSRLDVAIKNRIQSGVALNEYNRQVKLEIPQPPAQFKSAEEANLDASFQNKKAIDFLLTFMYYNDATNALSELIKNNEVVEFNNFYEQFKKTIGSRFLSYYEFIAYWDKFKENITKINSKILTIGPDEVKKLQKDIEHNQALEYFKSKYPEVSTEIQPLATTEILKKKRVEKKGKKLSIEAASFPTLGAPDYKFTKSQLEGMTPSELRTLISEEGGNPANIQDKNKLLQKIFNSKKIKDNINMGAGLHHFNTRGSGITSKHSLEHRYSIIRGEVKAGNNNPNLINEMHSLKKRLRV